MLYDKNYYATQALTILGVPIYENGTSKTTLMKLADEKMFPALDELGLTVDIKRSVKRAELPIDTNNNPNLGMNPGTFRELEFYFILPPDFMNLIKVNVNKFRISGDNLITPDRNKDVVIEYTPEVDILNLPSSARNLLCFILAKHLAIAMRKEEKLNFVMGFLEEEKQRIRFSEAGNENIPIVRGRLIR